jgi:hypothetical protein
MRLPGVIKYTAGQISASVLLAALSTLTGLVTSRSSPTTCTLLPILAVKTSYVLQSSWSKGLRRVGGRARGQRKGGVSTKGERKS